MGWSAAIWKGFALQVFRDPNVERSRLLHKVFVATGAAGNWVDGSTPAAVTQFPPGANYAIRRQALLVVYAVPDKLPF